MRNVFETATYHPGTLSLTEAVAGNLLGEAFYFFDPTNVIVLTTDATTVHFALHMSWHLDGPGWWTHDEPNLPAMEAWLTATFCGYSTEHIKGLTYTPQNWRSQP